MRRLAALALLAAVLAACGSADDAATPPPAPAKSEAQLAAEKLLRELEAEGGCDCTGEARARDRLADGRASRRDDGYVLRP